jgi:flagellar biosynthesis/type III secretory pathway chaperone
MTMNSDALQRLEAVLERELEAARLLATTLDAERVALTGTAPEAVVAHAAEKTRLFARIEALETERRGLCDATQITLPNLSDGRTPVIAGVTDAVADRWRALLELVASCRVANEVNGYIVNARRGQVQQLFQVLRGGNPLTYGPQGKTFAASLRALARA